jgi:hypothetical protein
MTAISRFFAVSSAWNHGEATQDGATATFCLSTWFCPNWGLQQKIAIKVGKTMLSSSAFWGSLNMLKEIPITLFGRLPSFLLELCFFVVWARILLCCLRRCLRNAYAATVGAYAAHPFEGVPTQAQRPCKATPQCTFLPTPSHFRLLLEGWKRNFCLRDHSPIHIFAKWGALRHPALPAAARAPRLQSAHRHLAATPMCSSRTSNQVPKRTLNIWWINHDKSLKIQLVTFDYAGVKPSDVFDCR